MLLSPALGPWGRVGEPWQWPGREQGWVLVHPSMGTVIRTSVLCVHPLRPPLQSPWAPLVLLSALQPARVSLQDSEVPGGQEEVQGDLASLRRQGRHRAVLSRAPGHAGQDQEPADTVSCSEGGGTLGSPRSATTSHGCWKRCWPVVVGGTHSQSPIPVPCGLPHLLE